jgi:hypothetical protein
MTYATALRFAALSLGSVAMLLGTAHRLQSQELRRATVALVRELPDTTARATIIRTAERSIVLMRERDAYASTLASAMESLFRSRRNDGEVPDKTIRITLHGQRRLERLAPNERQLAERYLARLRSAPVESLDSIGYARVTTIAVAPLRKDGKR